MADGTKNQDEPSDPRVFFAAERTLLAWVRTGLAMMGFGFVVARFGLFLREIAAAHGDTPIEQGGLSMWFGTALICLAVAVNFYGAWQYMQTVRQLKQGKIVQPQVFSMGVVLAAVLGVLGIAIAGYLLLMG